MALRPQEHIADVGVRFDDAAHDLLEFRAKPQRSDLLELVEHDDHLTSPRAKRLRQCQDFAQLLRTHLSRRELKGQFGRAAFVKAQDGAQPLEEFRDMPQSRSLWSGNAVDGTGIGKNKVIERGDIHQVQADAENALRLQMLNDLRHERRFPVATGTVKDDIVAAINHVQDGLLDFNAVVELPARDFRAVSEWVSHADIIPYSSCSDLTNSILNKTRHEIKKNDSDEAPLQISKWLNPQMQSQIENRKIVNMNCVPPARQRGAVVGIAVEKCRC